jgi:acyl dehydratase
MLVLSYAVGQAYQLGFLERTGLSFRSVDMKFSVPVYIGDTIHAELIVKEKKEARRLGGGTVLIEVRIIKQDGQVAQRGEWVALVASRAAQADSAGAVSTGEESAT